MPARQLVRHSTVAILFAWSLAVAVAHADDRSADTSQPPTANTNATTAPRPRHTRVLFITSQDAPQCERELARLNASEGDFAKLRSRGWKIGAGPENHLQIVDQAAIPELIAQLQVHDYPTVACISDGSVLRSFQSGCTTPLDMWTFGWLAKGIDERPASSVPEAARAETTGHYPLRGNHWSVDGAWTPARETVISHLRSPAHVIHLDSSWAIDTWSYEELRSLHDNLHEQFGGGVSASRAKSTSRSSNQFSANRKIQGR
jgi:hypothetical protein